MAKNTTVKKTTVAAPTFNRGDKLKRAVDIVREQFAARIAALAAGKVEADMESPRSLAIAQIAKELFPGDQQKAACNTYFALAYDQILAEGNEAAQVAIAKGKPVYSVYNLHRAKLSRDKQRSLEGTVSKFGLVTSQAAAKDLMKLLMADGFCKGQVTKDAKPLAA